MSDQITALFSPADGTARWTQGLLIATLVLSVMAFCSGILQMYLLSGPTGSITPAAAAANDSRQQIIGICQVLLYLGTAAAFLTWFYGAHRNLPALGCSDLKYSPGWAVGGFFVPFLNLVRPFQVMREIWHGSDPSRLEHDLAPGGSAVRNQLGAPALIGWWWGVFLVGGILGRISWQMALAPNQAIGELQALTGLQVFCDLLDIPGALLAVSLISRITSWQAQRAARVQQLASQPDPDSHAVTDSQSPLDGELLPDGQPLAAPAPGMPVNFPTMVRGPEPAYTAPHTSGLAIASLVLGLLGIFLSILTAIPGLVLGIIALGQIKRNRPRLAGEGLAIGGIVASCVTMFMSIFMAGILLPVFAQARERARSASCENNLKQVGIATVCYAQDYDEKFPPAAHWGTACFPYIKSYEVFRCPDDRSGSRSSYAYNAALGGLSLAGIAEPSNTAVVFEARSNWDVAGGADLLTLRHSERANLEFVDGHVKALSGDNLASIAWNPAGSPDSSASAGSQGRSAKRRI